MKWRRPEDFLRGVLAITTGLPSSAEARVEADGFAMSNQPLGAGLHVFRVLWLRRDTGEADVIAEFVNKALLVALQIIQDQCMGRSIGKRSQKPSRLKSVRPRAMTSFD